MRFPTKTFIKSLQLSFSRRHGQSFLVDENIAAKIIALSAISPDDSVIEIGPGLGSLTSLLLRRGIPTTAFELDRRLFDIVTAQLPEASSVRLHNKDFLDVCLCDYALHSRPLVVLGNIPYSITTPLIHRMLEQSAAIGRALLLVQREVAQRMCSRPSSKGYGITAVLAQAYFTITNLMAVSAASFFPRPQVDSMLIQLVPHQARRWLDAPELSFQQIVATAFAQRRKTLRNSLEPYLIRHGICSRTFSAELSAAGISLSRRPETLTVQEFDCLAESARQLASRA